MTNESLFDNEWISLRKIVAPELGIKGYVYAHEKRCNGRIVSILPYREYNGEKEYLLKSEVTPAWSVTIPIISTTTGGIEGSRPRIDAVRELEEETGYRVKEEELVYLGESFSSKSSDTMYSLYSVDLTGKEPGEILGDGSQLEKEATVHWLEKDAILLCDDPFASVIYLRLQDYLSKI